MLNFQSLHYDVVVCGAGPAGLMAACTLGRLTGSGRRILLLDKKEPWKEPIFCAEAVSTDRLQELWPVDQSWVRGPLSGIYFTSPKGYKAEFYSENCGILLNRAGFHHALADACESASVECHFDCVVKKLERSQDETWTVSVKSGDQEAQLHTKVVIDATGPGARLTNRIPCLEGIESGDTDLEPAIFAVAEGIEHSREHIDLFFGSDFPSGYGWIFPRDGKEVNIGFVLGVDAKIDEPLREKLKKFVLGQYPGASIKAIYGGMIACGQSTKPIAKCGLFKAGDAASCVNPISRSGIVEALRSGKIVAESAKMWLEASDDAGRKEAENKAFKDWMKVLGNGHLQVTKGKKAFNSISDAQLDKAAASLSKLPKEKQTLLRIFFTVLRNCPSLIWKLRSFLHSW